MRRYSRVRDSRRDTGNGALGNESVLAGKWRSTAGFSFIEIIVVIVIIGVVFAMAFESFHQALPSMRADSAMLFLETQLRVAREASIDERRNVTVQFAGGGQIVAYIQPLTGSGLIPLLLYDYTLPALPEGLAYGVLTGVPDTPDAYGNASPGVYGNGVYACSLTAAINPVPVGTSCTIEFQSDGSVWQWNGSTGNYVIENGSIFMGITAQPRTARAVNILGSTGKIKAWRYNGTVWLTGTS
ncbi:MAG: prepilin-type N-terminal cleavage/methylation domain-containing protein [Terriglobia bacterium]